jgi:hypothetical protein
MMLLFALLSTALATGISSDEVPCPLGEGLVKRFHKISANTMAGYDSDLVTYSTRGQFRTHAISTCPDNFFSALGSKLDMTILQTDHKAIHNAIAEARMEWNSQEDPTVWERYDTAARIAIVLNHDPLEIAELYLNAAWTARDAAVGVYVGGLNGPRAAREILKVGTTELEKDLTPEAVKMLHYNLARVAHRGGFQPERDAHLQAFLALPSLSPEERAAAVRLKQLSHTVEKRYQERAIAMLSSGVKLPGETMRLARARYQLADTLRRIGKTEEAQAGFEAVKRDARSPDQIRELAIFLLDEINK